MKWPFVKQLRCACGFSCRKWETMQKHVRVYHPKANAILAKNYTGWWPTA